MFVYVITNKITGKIYIGQHSGVNLQNYLQKKFYHSRKQKTGSSYLFNAMRKYPDYRDWSIAPLFEGIETREELNRIETLLIALYDTRNPDVGYNICKGGEGGGMIGQKHSPQTKAKIKAANRGKHRERLLSQENQALRKAAYQQALIDHNGSFHTDDTADKIKAARAAQDESVRLTAFRKWEAEHGDERRERAAKTHTGKKHNMSPEGSAAISAAFKKSCAERWSKYSIIGKVFGRLTVVSKAESLNKAQRWNLVCECGGKTIATTTLLNRGNKKSCGCLARESSLSNLQRINSSKSKEPTHGN